MSKENENQREELNATKESLSTSVDKLFDMASVVAQAMPKERKEKIMEELVKESIDQLCHRLNDIHNMFGAYAAKNYVAMAIGTTIFEVTVNVEQHEDETEFNNAVKALKNVPKEEEE